MRTILAIVCFLVFSCGIGFSDITIDVNVSQSQNPGFNDLLIGGVISPSGPPQSIHFIESAMRDYTGPDGVKFVIYYDEGVKIFTGGQPQDVYNNNCYNWDQIDGMVQVCKEKNLKLMFNFTPVPRALLPDGGAHWIYDPPLDENHIYFEEYVYRVIKHITGKGYDSEVGNCLDFQLDYVHFFNEVNGYAVWWPQLAWTKEQVEKVYDYGVHGVKRADPKVKVGGFAAAPIPSRYPAGYYVDWFNHFLDHCTTGINYYVQEHGPDNVFPNATGTPVDFISIHYSYTSSFDLAPGLLPDLSLDSFDTWIADLRGIIINHNQNDPLGMLADTCPIINSEWNPGHPGSATYSTTGDCEGSSNEIMGAFQAAMLHRMLENSGYVNGDNVINIGSCRHLYFNNDYYWYAGSGVYSGYGRGTFTQVFVPDNVVSPSYNVNMMFRMLMGDRIAATEFNDSQGYVGEIACKGNILGENDKVALLVYNFHANKGDRSEWMINDPWYEPWRNTPWKDYVKLTTRNIRYLVKNPNQMSVYVLVWGVDGNQYYLNYNFGEGNGYVSGPFAIYMVGNYSGGWQEVYRDMESDLYNAFGVHLSWVDEIRIIGNYRIAGLEFRDNLTEIPLAPASDWWQIIGGEGELRNEVDNDINETILVAEAISVPYWNFQVGHKVSHGYWHDPCLPQAGNITINNLPAYFQNNNFVYERYLMDATHANSYYHFENTQGDYQTKLAAARANQYLERVDCQVISPSSTFNIPNLDIPEESVSLIVLSPANTIYVDAKTSTKSHELGTIAYPYYTIQEGIDAAQPGWTVSVGKGIYKEQVVMKEGVNIVGKGAAETIIDGGGTGSVVRGANNAEIRGFTITGSGTSDDKYPAEPGAGIFCDGVSLLIKDSIIKGNRYGIYVRNGGMPTVINCVFAGNEIDENINFPPALDSIGDKAVVSGELLTFTISATDPDGDTLAYSASNLPEGATFLPDTQKFLWIPRDDQTGTYSNVHFEVTDGNLSDAEDITITVLKADLSPVAVWYFDEGRGNTAYDSSSSNNHGAIYGATWTEDNTYRKALSFDGTADYIEISDDDSLDMGTDDFTLELWVKFNDFNGYQRLIDKSSCGQNGYTLYYGSGSLHFSIDNKKGVSEEYAYVRADNLSNYGAGWFHIVAVRSSSLDIYVNGVKATTWSGRSPVGIDVSNDYGLKIGCMINLLQSFNGRMDEVAVYRRALTEGEIRDHYEMGNRALLLHFDEGEGNTAYDSSSNNHGAIYGATWTEDSIAGHALNFDGTADYIEIPDDDSLDMGTDDFTLELWVKFNDFNGYQRLIDKSSCDQNGYTLYYGGGSLHFSIDNKKGASEEYAYVRADNLSNYGAGWFHIVAVRSSSLDIYVNGVKATTWSGRSPVGIDVSNDYGLKIGCMINLLQSFNGRMDEVAVYRRALTESEIRDHYEMGNRALLLHFDEGEGNTAYDSSSSINHGAIYGATWTEDSIAGHALSFDGTADYIEIPDDDSLDMGTDDFTLELWVKFNDFNGYQRLIDKSSCGQNGYTLYYGSGSLHFSIDNKKGASEEYAYVRADNLSNYGTGWFHIVAVRSSSLDIYVNGVKATTWSGRSPVGIDVSNDYGLKIGCMINLLQSFNGRMDEVAVYRRALSPAEIVEHYTGER